MAAAGRFGTPPRRPEPTRTFVCHSPVPGSNHHDSNSDGSYAADACSDQSDIRIEAAELSTFLQNSDSARHRSNEEFVIVTWNIWFAAWNWRERLGATLAETLDHHPDVVCWQEVTQNVHSIMIHCDFWRERYDPTEEQLPCSYDCSIWVRRGTRETGGESIKATGVSTIPIPTIFGRRGLCVDLKLSSDQIIRVMTTHLESGKAMANTRRAQLDVLRKAADRTPTLLVGDMNIDPTYPDNDALPGQDLWLNKHRDDPGFTEDTYVNEMRFWAHGGKQKRVRYDRIMLLNPPLGHRVVDMNLLGTTPFGRNGQMLWPSDHFGLVARMEM